MIGNEECLCETFYHVTQILCQHIDIKLLARELTHGHRIGSIAQKDALIDIKAYSGYRPDDLGTVDHVFNQYAAGRRP